MSAWKISISNEEMCLEKFGFIACDLLPIMKTGEGDHQTFTYACTTLLPRVKRENLLLIGRTWKKCIFDSFSQLVATELTSQKFHSFGQIAKLFFVDFWAFIDMYHA